MESNVVTSKSKDKWDVEASFAAKEESTLTVTSEQINYEKDWIIDSGCLNHITRDKGKL